MTIAAGNVQFTYAQLEAIWQQAGGNPQYGPMAAAIAMAESGGNSANYGINSNGSIDRGLWQINSVHGAQSSFDIMTNARAAVAISNNGSNWRPWCTAYSDGACGTRGGTYLGAGSPYQRFLQGGVPPDLSAPINGTNAATNSTTQAITTGGGCSWWETIICPGCCAAGDVAGGVAGGAEGIAANIVKALIGSMINPLIQITAGVLGMVGGGALVILGIFMMVRESQAYQQVKQKEMQAAAVAAAPETGGASMAAAGGSAQGASTMTTITGNEQQKELNARRRQQARENAKQMSTQDLLRQEAQRYGRQPA